MARQPQLAGHHHAGQEIAGLGDARPGQQPLERALGDRPDVADHDRHRGQRGQRRRPLELRQAQRGHEQAQEDRERGRLGRHGHERRDGGRRALVDVGRPLVEGGHRGLEGEADGGKRDAREQERVGDAHALAHRGPDSVQLRRAGGSVDQRQAVEQRGRAHRPDHQVLEAGLQRGPAPQLGRAQHVERDREQLEAHEEHDQVLGAGQDHHAGDRRQQERVVLAVRGLARGAAPQRQHDRHQSRHVEEHRDA